MATWVTHLMIADTVLEEIGNLSKREFCVGNVAPDCNVENQDWTEFTPPREVTHWMSGKNKVAADCDRFLHEYLLQKELFSSQEESFLLGYYSHLITDAYFQKFIRDEKRVKASWERIRQHPELRQKATGMEETWDSIKILISGKERMCDIHSIERDYLDLHPDSGYFTEIVGLQKFPDYLDFLPKGAIVRKIRIMGTIPQKSIGKYPFIGITQEEYNEFLKQASKLVTNSILRFYKEKTSCSGSAK